MANVRLGIVGVGCMGQCAHLRNYVITPGCEVVALAELREKQGRLAAARYGVPRVYKTHREMLDKEQLDGIVCIQHYEGHGQVLPELFAAGVPVITEKPLARSVEAGEKILAAMGRSKAKHYVAYHKRSDPASLYSRRTIQAWKHSGEYGRMRYVRITMPPGCWETAGWASYLGTDEQVDHFPRDPAPADMDGAVKEKWDFVTAYYIHQINYLRYMFDEDYEVVFADPNERLFVARTFNGVTGVIETAPYETTRDWQEDVLIAFDKAWIKIELPAPMALDRAGKVTLFTDSGQGDPLTASPTLPWVHAMRQQAEFFVQAIKGEPTPLCTAAEAQKDLQAALRYTALLFAEKAALPAGAR